MVSVPGEVSLGFVVYGNKSETVCACMYAFLTDAAAKDAVVSGMADFFGITMEAESDTVLKAVLDAEYIATDFAMTEENYGETIDPKDATEYAEILKMNYGVREYGGVNPYEPYDGHEDPEDLDYDKRAVLTGAGEYAVPDGFENDIQSVTDYVYAKDDVVVAQYTYYEFNTKENAERAMEADFFYNGELVEDTVVMDYVDAKKIDDIATSYIGYGIMEDKTLDSYVKMIEESYFSVLCE